MQRANDIIFVLSLIVALIFALPNLSLLRSTGTVDYIFGIAQLPVTLIVLLGCLGMICLQWLFIRLGLTLNTRKIRQTEEEIAQLRAQLQKKEAEEKAKERAKEVQGATPTAEEVEGE